MKARRKSPPSALNFPSGTRAPRLTACIGLCASLVMRGNAVAPIAIASLAALPACGKNFARAHAPEDPEEQARTDMEAGRYAEAQEGLEAHLASEPEDHAARSLLAAAIAAQGGVVLLDLLLEAGSKAEGSSGSSGATNSDADRIFALLPPATPANVVKLKAANAQMARIPASARTAAIKTQGSIFLIFEAFLAIARLKGDAAALASLSAADAARITSNIRAAASLSAGEKGNPFGSAASGIASGLSQSEGANEKEKVASYVARISQR